MCFIETFSFDIMARTSIYLNFRHNTEEAFNFYKSVFGGDFIEKGIRRFSDIPPSEGMPAIAEDDKHLIFHIALPIIGNILLMGSDMPESLGYKLNTGNNYHICIEPDTKDETKRLFEALSSDGQIVRPLTDMFWGGYYGKCIDKYGIQWIFNYAKK